MSENLMLQLNETKAAEYARYYELAKKVVAPHLTRTDNHKRFI